jgi:hypothetical protein
MVHGSLIEEMVGKGEGIFDWRLSIFDCRLAIWLIVHSSLTAGSSLFIVDRGRGNGGARATLLFDFFVSVLDVGVAHCDVRFEGFGFE